MAELAAWVDGQEIGRFSEHHVADGSSFTFEYLEGAAAEEAGLAGEAALEAGASDAGD